MADQVKRTAGQTDISKLTVDLIKEELRLRRARGEDIPRLPTSRGEALEMIADARRAVPNIPAPPVADPTPIPVVVVEATVEGRPRADPALVGRRVLSVESDERTAVCLQSPPRLWSSGRVRPNTHIWHTLRMGPNSCSGCRTRVYTCWLRV